MINIDAHHHLWRYRAQAYGWIGGSPVLAVQARQTVEETAACSQITGLIDWADESGAGLGLPRLRALSPRYGDRP